MPEDKEIVFDLAGAFGDFRRLSKIFIIVTISAGLLGFSASYLIGEKYQSEIVASVVEDDTRMPSFSGELGVLAGLAGVSINNSNKSSYILAILQSKKFIVEFIEKYDLKNNDALHLSGPADKSRDTKDCWFCSEKKRHDEESNWDAYRKFMKNMKFEYDQADNILKIRFLSGDADFSAFVLNSLIAELNDIARNEKVNEAKEAITYLNAQLKNTPIKDMHEVFYDLIKQQTQVVMLANIRKEFALKVIDPAVAPERKAYPKRGLFLVGGIVLAWLIFLFFLVYKNSHIK